MTLAASSKTMGFKDGPSPHHISPRTEVDKSLEHDFFVVFFFLSAPRAQKLSGGGGGGRKKTQLLCLTIPCRASDGNELRKLSVGKCLLEETERGWWGGEVEEEGKKGKNK